MPSPHRKILISVLAAAAILTLAASSLAAQSKNYWLVSSTGQVFAYGKAKTHGSEYHKRFRGTIKGIKGTTNGGGYWIVTSKTHYGFGDTSHYKYRAGGLKKYTGKTKPKGLKGKIVGYAAATIPNVGGGTHTTTTGTTTTPTTPPADCSNLAIQTGSLASATATDQYSQTLAAGGISGGSWSWAIESGDLPDGLSLSSTGTISGTPTQSTAATQSTFTVKAVNSQCDSSPVTKSYTLAVGVPPMSITTQSLNSGTYGEAYDQTINATGGQPANYQWSATGLPSGLSISTSGAISGTPSTYGSYTVGITVSDSTGATAPVTSYLNLSVVLPPLQITSPSSLSDGQATVAYSSVTFSATGGTAMEFPPADRAAMYDWSATGLPNGTSMSVHGVLSGTPTQQGTYSVQVTVADASGNVAPLTQTFNLYVAYAPLGFTTTTLTAIQGHSYTGNVVAQGGEAPYTMYRLAGSLPTGATFNDGTITVDSSVASGDYQFTIGLTDSQSSPATTQETFNLWVAASPTSPDLSVGSSMSTAIWAGYLEQSTSAFTSVSGTFTVPAVQDTPSNSVSPWVGIDGYGTNNLIQAGVTASVDPPGASTYEAWWETVGDSGSAQNLPPQNQFEVSPGDVINANIWQLSAGQWEITLNDATDGQGFATSVSYTGSDETAEWIVETPSGSAATGYGATSTFSNLAASQAGTGMVDLSTTGASPTSLTSGGFSITDYN